MNRPLNLPSFNAKIQNREDNDYIFDPVRKRYVALTPEEWVRQHFLNFLLVYKGYSLGLLAVEHPVTVNSMKQRVDIVAFNRLGKPILVVECKAPSVSLTQQTYAQAARYNTVLCAEYLVVTNGITHFCSKISRETNEFTAMPDIPFFSEIGE